MRIKRFEASSIQTAMEKVRKEMGPHAVILSTQDEEGEGEKRVVITAAVDRDFPGTLHGKAMEGGAENGSWNESTLYLEEGAFRGNQNDQIKSTLVLLKKMVDNALREHVEGTKKGAPWRRWVRLLENRGVEREAAFMLIKKLAEKVEDKGLDGLGVGHVRGVLARVLRVTGDLFQGEGQPPKFVVFLGPPGVGKTTTLAKLAARLKEGPQKPVVLLSTDVYRIGAMDQLNIYGNLMNLPVEPIYSKKDFHKICSKYPENTVFMVDTTGRSHVDDQGLVEIKILLDPMADNMWAFLLLDAGKKKENLLDEIKGFSLFPYKSLIWTKVDETRMPGEIINIFLRTRIPVSYITTGQNVPGDMEVAVPQRLAEIILTEGKSRSYLWTKRQSFAHPTSA